MDETPVTVPEPSVTHADMRLRLEELDVQEKKCVEQINELQKTIYYIIGARSVLAEWLNAPQS